MLDALFVRKTTRSTALDDDDENDDDASREDNARMDPGIERDPWNRTPSQSRKTAGTVALPAVPARVASAGTRSSVYARTQKSTKAGDGGTEEDCIRTGRFILVGAASMTERRDAVRIRPPPPRRALVLIFSSFF